MQMGQNVIIRFRYESEADPGGSDWGDRPPKTYESMFVHHNFLQVGKQHSRYKPILSAIVL